MTTKIPAELSSTPSISDSGNATAIVIDSSENVAIGANSTSTKVTIQAADSDTVNSSANGHLTFYDDAPFGYYKIRMATTNRDLAFDGYDTDNSWKEILKLDRVDQRINAKGGIMFGSDTAAANTLDDYEEGTFSPTITTESGATGQSYDRQYGFYTRIGDFVFLTFDVRITTVGTLSGSYLTLGGHGFTFEGTNSGGMGLCGWFGSIGNLTTNQVNFYCNDSYIFLMQGGTTYLTPSGNHLTSNSRLIGGFCGQINR